MVTDNTMESGKLTKTHALQTYISFVTFMFDIVSFTTVTFVAVQLGKAIYPGTLSSSLLVVWGGFAAGAVLRPVGAAIIGPIYDRIGRKRGLYVGIFGLVVFTALIGAIPTYAQVGIWSPVIYIVLRLIVGIFVGALIAGGIVFSTENVPEKLRGLFAGIANSGGSFSHAVGAAWLVVVSSIFVTATAMDTWGWRAMMLVSLLPLVLIIIPLHYVDESEIFVKAREKGKTVKHLYRKLLGKGVRNTFLLTLTMSVGILGVDVLTINSYPTFLKVVIHTPIPELATLMLFVGLISAAGPWVGGALSQITGRRKMGIFVSGALIALGFLYLYFGTLNATQFYQLLFVMVAMYFVVGMGTSQLTVIFNESFPTEIRSTATGLNWDIGYGIASFLPFIVTLLWHTYGVGFYPAAMVILIVIMGAIALGSFVLSRETRGNIAREDAELGSVDATPSS